MTLSITIAEDVRVVDALVGAVRRLLHQVASWLGTLLDEETHEGEQIPTEASNAPPALGISVGEEARTTEALS